MYMYASVYVRKIPLTVLHVCVCRHIVIGYMVHSAFIDSTVSLCVCLYVCLFVYVRVCLFVCFLVCVCLFNFLLQVNIYYCYNCMYTVLPFCFLYPLLVVQYSCPLLMHFPLVFLLLPLLHISLHLFLLLFICSHLFLLHFICCLLFNTPAHYLCTFLLYSSSSLSSTSLSLFVSSSSTSSAHISSTSASSIYFSSSSVISHV